MGKMEIFLKTHETLYKSLKYTLLNCITQLQNTDKGITDFVTSDGSHSVDRYFNFK